MQIPDAYFETEISVRERAHRTDIDDISGKRIVEHGVGERGDGRMIAAIDHRQLVGMRNFLKKTNAAGALDAALAIEDDVGAKNFPFTIVFLSRFEAACLQIMLHIIVLQPAFPRLVADRTVHRMIDEEKLHHRLPGGQNFRTLGQYRHPFSDLSVAGDLQLRHFLDFDETHAAVAGDGKLRMVTVIGNHDPHVGGRLDNGLAFGGADLFTVDVELNWIHER